ncbi:uncharacterized protein RCC_06241 [Ramularia collo-cygni]|uniref:N-alpha-acetyltransferase 40 n=1 Tax=Ramularia collo-cygni TaxID=112498 RepID=A0A2D3UUV0_9PEZI|nr:uncharacterized protein RCC_06241 [Ramularia collo-cygni]CZT20381.1 uncharacterized protein RCC_06241 [Ramularia collo-cygni]
MFKRKRKSSPISPTSAPKRSTLIKSLNALPENTFQTRFSPQNSPSHNHETTTYTTSPIIFSQTLPPTLLNKCFSLIATTSQQDYETSSFGWHPTRKLREMQDRDMRFLLLYSSPSSSSPSKDEDENKDEQFQGFTSFTFTHDSHPAVPVLYVYEIHLVPSAQGIGLGKFLMDLVLGIARKAGVEKVMLTCFVANERALGAYRKWGFGVDVCSPGERRLRGKIWKADYVIMSLELGGDGDGDREGGEGEWEDDDDDGDGEVEVGEDHEGDDK